MLYRAMSIPHLLLFASTIYLLTPIFAVLPPAPLLTGGMFQKSPNSTLPVGLNNTPRDPWDMRVPYTTLTIEWYGYRDPLPVSEAQHCINEATLEAMKALRSRVMSGLGHVPYSYSYGGVNLWLRLEPDEVLKWLFWLQTLRSFTQYGEANEWRGTQFLLLRYDRTGGTSLVAIGQLLAQ